MIVQTAWANETILRQNLFYSLRHSMPGGSKFVFGDLITELAMYDVVKSNSKIFKKYFVLFNLFERLTKLAALLLKARNI